MTSKMINNMFVPFWKSYFEYLNRFRLAKQVKIIFANFLTDNNND